MKYKNLKFKLIFLLALGCFTASNVMPVAAGNDADVKPSENNKPVENINVKGDVKPGENKDNKPSVVVGPQEVSGFKLLKEMKITDKPADSIYFYEHELTKMKFVVVPHDYLKLLCKGYDYYIFFRVKDGEMRNGLGRFDEKHILEHLVGLKDSDADFYVRNYNFLFGLGNTKDVNDSGFSNAVTMGSGIGFECSNLRCVDNVFDQLENPLFKTDKELFKREVVNKKANYTSGRILSEMTIANCRKKSMDDDGNLYPEFSKALNFLGEDNVCSVPLPRTSIAYSKFSEKEIFDGACEILDEMTGNFGDSMMFIPNYSNISNTPSYSEMMRHIDVRCLSKFKGRANNGKKPRNEKVVKFESKPFELVTEGITGDSDFFDYWEFDESNEQKNEQKDGGKGSRSKPKRFKARNVAYLKVNLFKDNDRENGFFVRELLCSKFVRDKVKQLGYKECFASLRYLTDKTYLLVELFGDDDSLFDEAKLRDTYRQMLEEVKSKNADDIYKISIEKEMDEKKMEEFRKHFNYERYFRGKVDDLLRSCKMFYELTGGFDDPRLTSAYDDFKKKTNDAKDEKFFCDPKNVKKRFIDNCNAALGVEKGFENSPPEILVLRRPGKGGEEVKFDKDVVEQYRKAGPTYEVHFKFKDGFNADLATIRYGLMFLSTIGFNGELGLHGVYYGSSSELQREPDGANGKYYLIYPVRERGGFDELFNSPEQIKAVTDKVLNMLNDKDFDKFKAEMIECFESGGEEAKEYLRKEMGFEFEDFKKMTLAGIRSVIENVVIGETKLLPKQ